MSILKTIYDNNLVGEPLFIEDFVSDKLSYDSVKTLLSRYVKFGFLRRYAQGIYYAPEFDNVLGEIPLDTIDIIEKRFIHNKDKIYGYYSGLKLLNIIGISNQVPNVIEISSNKEKSFKKNITIGKRRIIVRKPYIEINNENYIYLQFFDIFRFADEKTIEKGKEKIIEFFLNNNLDIKNIKVLEKQMPMKIRNKIMRSHIYDELTQR